MENTNTNLHADCIRICLECHQICTATVAHVLHNGGNHSETKHLIALLDCAQFCALSADFMSRLSPHHHHISKECAEICNACADMCEAHEDPDGQMKRCAEACRRCAESCAGMSA